MWGWIFLSKRMVFMNLFYLLKPKATVTYLNKTDTVRQGPEKLRANGFTAIPVIDDNGEYIGTVSEGDFLRHIMEFSKNSDNSLDNYNIIDIVNEERNRPVKNNVTMDDLLLKVMDQNFVPVIDDRNTFIGIVTRKAVIQYFYNKEKRKNEGNI